MTPITVTLGNRPELDAEERRARAMRARDVLNEAGWVFDELISNLNGDLLGTQPEDTAKREAIFHQINGAAQAKGLLLSIIQGQQLEDVKNERRNRAESPADSE